ncbi:MAG: CYTH domain-containing protein [Alphaproteobacteria bacterium]|nr:CYTH domain-containing protein [Alphaproteobacteria bacterium]
MALEIERKFLVVGDRWREHVTAKLELKDGLLSRDGDKKVRVRSFRDRATLAVKSRAVGMRREEFEYEIPVADAEAMLRLCGELVVEKTRNIVPWLGHTWEVDVYHGALKGIVIAEIELPSETTTFERPSWVGAEVTSDPRYKKIYLLTERLARRKLQAAG